MNTALDASVTLEDVLYFVGAKRVPMAPELAGYLVLELALSIGTQRGALDTRNVFVGEEGSVAAVFGASAGDPEGTMRILLGKLLDAAGTQTPALAAIVKRASSGDLAAFGGEVEAALIPVNRAAGRRALARLSREVRRAVKGVGRNVSVEELRRGPKSGRPDALPSQPPPSGVPSERPVEVPRLDSQRPGALFSAKSPPSVGGVEVASNDTVSKSEAEAEGRVAPEDDFDRLLGAFDIAPAPPSDLAAARALKAMAGLDPTPPPAAAELIVLQLAQAHSTEPGPGTAEAADEPTVPRTDVARARSDAKVAPPSVAQSRLARGAALPAPKKASRSSLDEEALEAPPKARSSVLRIAAFLLLLLLVGGAVGYAWLRGQGKSPERMLGLEDPRPSATANSNKTCAVTALINGAPANAEVLLRKGQGPIDVGQMPVGARIEFVVTAEGYVPKRGVVAPGAVWERKEGSKPRLELPIELMANSNAGRATAQGAASSVAAWPAAEGGTQVGGEGDPGLVRVVTSPRGAEVWLLVGLGETAKYGPLGCDADAEFLIAQGTFRKSVRISKEELRAADAQRDKTVRLSVKTQ
jgi:hypothetical protein